MHKKTILLFSLMAMIGYTNIAIAADHKSSTHQDSSMMMHSNWMFKVKYSHMLMNGLRDGSNNISTNGVFNQGYMVTPTRMTTNMVMISAMYHVNSRLSIMAMLPYAIKLMQMQMRTGVSFGTRSQGFADAKLQGNYAFFKSERQKLLFMLGVSLPIGSINKRNNTPMANNQLLGYPMQLGSGTFDPFVGITYTYKLQSWTFGAQANTVQHAYKNSHKYALGNQYSISTWINKMFTTHVSGFLKLNGLAWGEILGADPDLNASMSPVANPNVQGGKQINIFVGMAFNGHHGFFKGQQITFDVGAPLYQHLNGPQLKSKWQASVEWSLMV